MKAKWKTTIGALVLFVITILAVMTFGISSLDMRSVSDSYNGAANYLGPDPSPAPPLSQYGPLDRLLNQMEFGSIAFNVPTNINIDDSRQIQLILSLADTVEELKQAITEEGERVGATIRVSDRMEARLSGYMFQITAITSEIQAVSSSEPTQWKWEILPKEEGRHQLHLTITALLE